MRPVPPPRKLPRQARSQQTVEAILDAAARVFGRDGYAGATTNRIADVAGVSIGSVYQYFPNKDALVVALHARHSRRMQAVMTAVLDGTNEASLRDNIAGLVRALVAAHMVEPGLHRILEREFPFFDDAPDPAGPGAVAVARVERLLAVHRDELAVDDLALAAWIVLRTLESLVHAAVLEPSRAIALPALEAAITDLVSGYLLAGDRPPRVR
ncbi:MAG: TetR/AcrR family transcriptional regulator [Burkholderiales bacterium]|jgi:AcrR family transcriptional regulator